MTDTKRCKCGLAIPFLVADICDDCVLKDALAENVTLKAKVERIERLCPDIAHGPKIICLSGSSRFVCDMSIIAWELEKAGNIVFGLHLLPDNYFKGKVMIPDHLAEVEGVSDQMDELHLRKIDLADELFVINMEGYIGDSTRREIAYAARKGKRIRYWDPTGGILPEKTSL